MTRSRQGGFSALRGHLALAVAVARAPWPRLRWRPPWRRGRGPRSSRRRTAVAGPGIAAGVDAHQVAPTSSTPTPSAGAVGHTPTPTSSTGAGMLPSPSPAVSPTPNGISTQIRASVGSPVISGTGWLAIGAVVVVVLLAALTGWSAVRRAAQRGVSGEEVLAIHAGVADLGEDLEAGAERRVLLGQPGVVVRLGRVPGVEESHLLDARLEQLLEAAEAGLHGRGDRGAQRLLAEAGGGEQGVLLGVDADADVVGAAAQAGVEVALGAAPAAPLGAVRASRRGCRCSRC